MSTFGVLEDEALAFLKFVVDHLAGENRSRAALIWREFYLRIGATLQVGNARCLLRWLNMRDRGGYGGLVVPPPRWMVMNWEDFTFKFVITEEMAQQRLAVAARVLF